jgi:hypothetical protein
MSASELEQLRRDVAWLKDHQAILDCISATAAMSAISAAAARRRRGAVVNG